MNYPVEILPQSGRAFISCDLTGKYLLRYCEVDEITDPETGFLTDKAIGEPAATQMPDMSTSLLGIFMPDHISIHVFNKDYQVECEPDIDVPVPIYKQDFSLIEKRNGWYILISKIAGKKAEYINGETKKSTTATCEVFHTPMKWNYWHFSVRWFVHEFNEFYHKLSEEKKQTWYKKLSHAIRVEIKKYGTDKVPDIIPLEEQKYQKAVI